MSLYTCICAVFFLVKINLTCLITFTCTCIALIKIVFSKKSNNYILQDFDCLPHKVKKVTVYSQVHIRLEIIIK